MENKQFSTSRGHVILVSDMLSRYQPDALRYYICAAGPETSDADFTWADFVLRTNSELVAGWGNLVNRTATMVAKSFGEIPAAGPLEPEDEAVLAAVRAGFDTVGDLIGRQRLRSAVAEAMRVVGEVNKYLTVTEPYKMKDESQRERLATVLHVAAQCVVDCNTLLSPFLPHSSNQVHLALGGEGEFMPMPRIETVEELDRDNGAGLDFYPVITGDYSRTPAWESRPVTVGAKVEKPTPIFTKLDPAIVDEELARLAHEVASVTVAILGDHRGHRSHLELDALRPILAERGVGTEWVPTDSAFDVTAYDGVWLVPGGPYADDAAVRSALGIVREREIPFLGTCSGMQYAVVEYAASVLGERATHAEADGESEDNVVAPLACSLYGEERLVTPVPGTRFASWVAEPFVGMHFCNFAPTAAVVQRLEAAGVVVGATAPDAGAEVLEFPDHPFYVTSLFQPHVGTLAGAPVHALVTAFTDAVAVSVPGHA